MSRRSILVLALGLTTVLIAVLVGGWLDLGPMAGHVGGTVPGAPVP
ncbi:MAG TPA: hypothetical protein VFL99_02765 [Segeticoccus sp.]|nr:hypothetical protein [Segeticoccus sp.]HET8599220.1 hypothetical protein [Segeticoccus sp.]